MAQEDTGQKRVAAPYIAYPTIKTFLAPLKEHVIPNRIDKSLLKSMSGAVQSQLMTALKFLRLIEDDGRPTGALTKLVAAYGTDSWRVELQRVLASAYPELFKIELEKVTASQFNEAFKAAYPCEGETLSKGVRFFLTAAAEAGVKFSPFLLKNTKPRTGAPTKRRARVARNGNGHRENKADPAPPPVNSSNKVVDRLLDKFPEFNPEWSEEIQAKWFEGYERLLAMGSKDDGGSD